MGWSLSSSYRSTTLSLARYNMKLSRQWEISVPKEQVWKVITNFNKLADLALFTKDFITSEQNIKKGITFSEIHYFLGKRFYTGKFLRFQKPVMWELESYPKEGTGFPVYHRVS